MTTPKRIDINGTGQFLDAVQVDQGLGNALRETVVVSDPTDPSAMQEVTNSAPCAAAYGAVVREASWNADAFGRLRTSNPEATFASFNEYKINPFDWVTSTVGTGSATHSTTTKFVTLSTGGTAANASAILQSRCYQRYTPGKSLYIDMTFLLDGQPPTNCVKRVGYFDASNGIFLEYRSTGLYLVIRSSVSGVVVDDPVAQIDWDDPLNGNGASGVTLHPEYGQIFWIDLQFLGMGQVRAGFNIDGANILAHTFRHANRTDVQPYMATANLPVRYEITNIGIAGGVDTLLALCAKVDSEGGTDLNGLQFTVSNGATGKATTTQLVPIISIRPAPTVNGITNRGWVMPENIALFIQGTSDHYYQLIWNPTLATTANWTAVNANSITQYDVTATTVSLGTGAVIEDGYIVGGTAKIGSGSNLLQIFSNRPLTNSFDGTTPDVLTIAARAITGSGTAFGTVSWTAHW